VVNRFWDSDCPACHDMREMCPDHLRMEGLPNYWTGEDN
jgi:hypothetical protein